jgi:O-antigen/teichoic acid export membrane protein
MIKSLLQNIKKYITYNKTTLLFGSSNFTLLIFNSVFSLFILKYVSPEDLGYYNKVVLISSYLVLMSFSVGVIVQKDVPGLLSTNKKEEAFIILKNVKGYFLGILIPLTIFLLAFTVYSFFIHNYILSLSSLLILVNIWQLIYVNKYLKLLYRTSNEFNKLSKSQFLSSLIYLPSIVSLFFLNYIGLYLKHLYIFVFEIIYLTINAPYHLKAAFERKIIYRILKESLPIFLVNIFFNYYFLIISTYFAFYFDNKTFGFFSLFFLIVSAFNKLIVSVEKVFYVSFSETVHKKENVSKAIQKFVKNTLIPFVIIYLFGFLIINQFLDNFILRYTPKYIDAVEIIKLTMIYVTFLFFKFFNVIYDNLNMQKTKLYSVLIKYITSLVIISYCLMFRTINPELLIKILIISEIPSIIFNSYVTYNLKFNNR